MAMVAIDIVHKWNRLEEGINWGCPVFGKLFW
jgi:hypothetical protein